MTQFPSLIEIFKTKSRIKILKLLAIEEEESISNITKKTNLNHSIVHKNLEKLKKLNILTDKYFGRTRIVRWKSHILANSVKKLLKIWTILETDNSMEKIDKFYNLLKKFLNEIS